MGDKKVKLGIIHKHHLGDNFVMPSYLSKWGIKTVRQRILSGEVWGYKNHKAYADHNGYKFIEDREPWYDTKAPDWAIWQAALRALKDPNLDVDWIFFSINDIIFVDFDIRLDSYLYGIDDSKFLCTGKYLAKYNWGVRDGRAGVWEKEVYPEARDVVMLSGWSHYVKKCPEAIEFLEMLDQDERCKNIPEIYNHVSTGDEYISVWYHSYPEYRKYWHFYSAHDHTHIPANYPKISKWNEEHKLSEYQKGKALMVFTTCAVSFDETVGLMEKYTKDMIDEDRDSPEV